MTQEPESSSRHFSVYLFGDIEITDGSRTLKEADLHSRQVQRLLLYMFGNMGRQVPDSELIDSLWEKEIANPSNALRNLVYRLRKALAVFWPDVDFIMTGSGQHYINPDLQIDLDVRQFQEKVSLCVHPNGQAGSLWDMAKTASLYRGKFAKNFGDFGWSRYVQTWFSEQYVLLSDRLCSAFLEKGLPYHAEYWVIRAMGLEPDEERLHVIYLRVYLAQHRMEKARNIFKKIVHEFYEDGREPLTEELEKIRSSCFPDISVSAVSLKDVIETIRKDRSSGPIYTDRAEFNKIACLEEMRAADCHGQAQILLFRLRIREDDNFGSENSFSDKAEAHFKKCLNCCLRKFDVVTNISQNEFLILLPDCGRKQGKAAAKRIEEYFLHFRGGGQCLRPAV